jgi:DNA-binding transcriptional LysR family regulator
MKPKHELNILKSRPGAPARLDFLRVRHLRFIALLHELGSLAAVAERVSVSASAASMMLREIDNLLGAQLFRRAGRGMAPTQEGEGLLARVHTILGEVGALGSALEQPAVPLLRIGAFPHTTMTVLPAIVVSLTLRNPVWRLRLQDESADVLLRRLLDAEIDLVIGRLPRSVERDKAMAELTQRPLYQGSLSVVCRRGHPLERARKLSIAELSNWPWILPGLDSTTRIALIEAFMREGLAPPVPVIESPSFFYSLSLVAQTDYLTCCANAAAFRTTHRLAVLPIEIDAGDAPVSLIWRRTSAVAERAVLQLEANDLGKMLPAGLIGR